MTKEALNPLDLSQGTAAERQRAIAPLLEYNRTYAAPAVQGMPPRIYEAIEPRLVDEIRENISTSGKLFAFRHRDDSGRLIGTFEGDIMAPEFMGAFDSPPIRIAFNQHAGRKFSEGRWIPEGSHVQVVPNHK